MTAKSIVLGIVLLGITGAAATVLLWAPPGQYTGWFLVGCAVVGGLCAFALGDT